MSPFKEDGQIGLIVDSSLDVIGSVVGGFIDKCVYTSKCRSRKLYPHRCICVPVENVSNLVNLLLTIENSL